MSKPCRLCQCNVDPKLAADAFFNPQPIPRKWRGIYLRGLARYGECFDLYTALQQYANDRNAENIALNIAALAAMITNSDYISERARYEAGVAVPNGKVQLIEAQTNELQVDRFTAQDEILQLVRLWGLTSNLPTNCAPCGFSITTKLVHEELLYTQDSGYQSYVTSDNGGRPPWVLNPF